MDAVSSDSGSAPAADLEALWERHGQRLVTLCTRVTASPAAGRRAAAATFAAVIGADPAPLGPRLALVVAALRACERELATGMVEPETVPVAGGGPLAALVSRTAAANAALPENDRMLLALRLVNNLSCEQIAAVVTTEDIPAALAHARLALRAGLAGEAVAPATGDCERARVLLVRRQDGERLSSADSTWLAAHEAGCGECAAARQAMQEAEIAYRAWPEEDPGRVPDLSPPAAPEAEAATTELRPEAATAEVQPAASAEPEAPADPVHDGAPPPGRRRRRWFR